MKRFVAIFAVVVAVTALVIPVVARDQSHGQRFALVEATLDDIARAFRTNVLDPSRLVQMYQTRIAAYDQSGPHLNAYMHVNAHALAAARALEREHGRGHRGPLWGIPIILKDNVDTR